MNASTRELQRKNAGDRTDHQIELKALNDSLAKRDTEIKSWCEKAAEEIKALGKASSETVQALTKLSEGGAETQARLLDVEQKLARRPGNADDEQAKSIGHQFTDTEDFQAVAKKGRGIARMGLKAEAARDK